MKLAMMSALAAAASVSAMELNQWTGKSLVKLNLETAEEQVRFAQIADKFDLDVWNRNIDTTTGASTVEVVSDARLDGFAQEMVKPDLEAHFADFFATEPVCNNDPLYCIGNATKSGVDSFYENYQRLDTIFTKMAAIDSSSELVESFSLGSSYEGRDIRGFKITGASGFGGDKKIAVYNCGIHARVGISPPPIITPYFQPHFHPQHYPHAPPPHPSYQCPPPPPPSTVKGMDPTCLLRLRHRDVGC
jgi:hypothetical protein